MTILTMLIVIVLIAFVMNWIAEAEFHHVTGELHIGAVATARTAGEVVRTASGRAAYVDGLNAVAASGAANLVTAGVVKIKKSTSVNFLPGQQVWWDATNNQATYELAGTFFVGICVDIDTVAAATTQVTVDLNVHPYYDIDIDRDGFDTAPVTTAGSPTCTREGGPYAFDIASNDEAEKVDMLSRSSIAITGDGIFEGVVNVIAASNAALDINVGIANATQNLHLAAAALGLGSQWVSVTRMWGSAIRRILEIPEVLEVHSIAAIGYPDYEPPAPYRRPLSELMHTEKYDRSKYRSAEDIFNYLIRLRQATTPAYEPRNQA